VLQRAFVPNGIPFVLDVPAMIFASSNLLVLGKIIAQNSKEKNTIWSHNVNYSYLFSFSFFEKQLQRYLVQQSTGRGHAHLLQMCGPTTSQLGFFGLHMGYNVDTSSSKQYFSSQVHRSLSSTSPSQQA